jgi:hypothetical protein
VVDAVLVIVDAGGDRRQPHLAGILVARVRLGRGAAIFVIAVDRRNHIGARLERALASGRGNHRTALVGEIVKPRYRPRRWRNELDDRLVLTGSENVPNDQSTVGPADFHPLWGGGDQRRNDAEGASRHGIEGIAINGFRSSSADWAAEQTNVVKEVVEKALAHKVPNAVEAAYRRTDFFQKRRPLLAEWDSFLMN